MVYGGFIVAQFHVFWALIIELCVCFLDRLSCPCRQVPPPSYPTQSLPDEEALVASHQNVLMSRYYSMDSTMCGSLLLDRRTMNVSQSSEGVGE